MVPRSLRRQYKGSSFRCEVCSLYLCVLCYVFYICVRSLITSNPRKTRCGGGEFAFGVVSQSFFLSLLFQPAPDWLGGRRGVRACVCHRLRLFIGGEKQITMQKFISCLTHTGFELRVGLGTPGHGAAGRSLACCVAGGRVLEMNFRDVAFTFNKELIGRRVRIDYNCDSLFKVIS